MLKKYLETNENGNTTYQNNWNAATAVLKWSFIAINAYINKQAQYLMNSITLHLNKL